MVYFNNQNRKPLPDYYWWMYLDGYTPEEIFEATRRSMRKMYEEAKADDYDVSNIHITSEIKIR